MPQQYVLLQLRVYMCSFIRIELYIHTVPLYKTVNSHSPLQN